MTLIDIDGLSSLMFASAAYPVTLLSRVIAGHLTSMDGQDREELALLEKNIGDLALVVRLGWSCGLRPGEATAVRKGDFIDGGRTLRLTRQRRADGVMGGSQVRSVDAYRDIPVTASM
jgi:integrase